MPPGPVSVTSRTPRRRGARGSPGARASRPTNADVSVGRLFGRRSRVASGGNSAGRSGWASWKRRSAGRGPSADARRGRAAWRRPGGAADERAVASDSRIWPPWPAAMIRAVRLTAGPKKSPPRDSASPVWIPIRTRIAHVARPRLREQRRAGRRSAAVTAPVGGEDRHEPVAGRLDDLAARSAIADREDHVVARERRAHRLRVLLPEAGAALDVGEQEGQRRVAGCGRRSVRRLLRDGTRCRVTPRPLRPLLESMATGPAVAARTIRAHHAVGCGCSPHPIRLSHGAEGRWGAGGTVWNQIRSTSPMRRAPAIEALYDRALARLPFSTGVAACRHDVRLDPRARCRAGEVRRRCSRSRAATSSTRSRWRG